MVIDIINYTDEQYAALTVEQLKEIRAAQVKKDNLQVKLQDDVQKEKDTLVKKGIFNSKLFQLIEEKLEAEYERQVELIRDGLQFYLKYSMQPNGAETDAPYTINYALSYEERFAIVRSYYETEYTDAKERYIAFQNDKYALQYLGELYASLYAYFRGLSEAQG